MASAQEWIETDKLAVANDIERLGADGAARYQMELIAERVANGDRRWGGITEAAMLEALSAL